MEPKVRPRIARRYYLDWARVIMILMVFFGHSMMPFIAGGDWHITNPERTYVVTALIAFGYFWGMPFFLVVAGASAGASLRARGAARYIRERFTRIFIPFVVGMLTIAPIQKYYEFLHNKSYQGSFFSFYPRFFQDAKFGWNLDLHLDTYHLWFIQFLFDFCVISLPVFLWLDSEQGRKVIDSVANLLTKPGALFLTVIPAALVQAAMRPIYPQYGNWGDFYFWLVFFVYGYFLTADERIEKTVDRYMLPSFCVGILSFASVGAVLASGHVDQWQNHPSYTLGCFFYATLSSLNTVAWVTFFMSLNIRLMSFRTSWLRQLNEAVAPFYILHHLVITIVAFYVVQLTWGILPKFLTILLLSFVITVSTYVFLIRLISPLRPLFGMRRRSHVHAIQLEVPSTSAG